MRLAGPCEATEEEESNLAAIIDEAKAAKKTPTLPITGPDMAKRMRIGTRVVRGPDWKWGDQVQQHDLLDCEYPYYFPQIACAKGTVKFCKLEKIMRRARAR